jgi:putative acetyltransferase
LSDEFLDAERARIPDTYLPNGDSWVALHKKSVAGFIILNGNEVGALFVDPKFHRSGIGQALMNKAREIHENLIVEVFEKNTIE